MSRFPPFFSSTNFQQGFPAEGPFLPRRPPYCRRILDNSAALRLYHGLIAGAA
jgi:hypothetical protein